VTDDLKQRRILLRLGQRALDYYLDTGECVFCDADDLKGVPHDDEEPGACEVGKATALVVTPERLSLLRHQHAQVRKIIFPDDDEG
jgi:hypothetical protein